jgi:hypothetical protein
LKYRRGVIVKTCLSIAFAASIAVAGAEDPFAHSPWLHKWKDVQFYLKPKTGFIGNWDQEIGLQATIYRSGNYSNVINTAYDPTYNIRLDQKPRFTVGLQFGYQIIAHPFPITIYDKPKEALIPYVYKNESGISAKIYDSPALKISTNLAYVFTFPYRNNQKPQFLGLINFQFPLGR